MSVYVKKYLHSMGHIEIAWWGFAVTHTILMGEEGLSPGGQGAGEGDSPDPQQRRQPTGLPGLFIRTCLGPCGDKLGACGRSSLLLQDPRALCSPGPCAVELAEGRCREPGGSPVMGKLARAPVQCMSNRACGKLWGLEAGNHLQLGVKGQLGTPLSCLSPPFHVHSVRTVRLCREEPLPMWDLGRVDRVSWPFSHMWP